MAWDDAFRQEMAGIRDEILGDLGADGLVMNQEIGALLVTRTYVGANPDIGDLGTPTDTYLVPSPRPSVVLKEQWRTTDGTLRKVGDGKLTVSRQVTREQLEAAAFWLVGAEMVDGVPVGGERYDMVQGYLKQLQLAWEVMLARRTAQADG